MMHQLYIFAQLLKTSISQNNANNNRWPPCSSISVWPVAAADEYKAEHVLLRRRNQKWRQVNAKGHLAKETPSYNVTTTPSMTDGVLTPRARHLDIICNV